MKSLGDTKRGSGIPSGAGGVARSVCGVADCTLTWRTSAQNMGSLHATLRKYVEPELLSGENQWQCDDAGTRVDAHKGLAFK